MKKLCVVTCCIAMLFAFSPVFAQNAGKIEAGDLGFNFFTGFSIGEGMLVGNDETVLRIYGIGLAYHPVSFFAIEPGVFFKKGSYERVDVADDPDSISTEDYLMIGSSIGLYYYSDFGNGLYLYLGPRFDLSRTEEDDKSSSPGWSNKSETREMDYSISFIVGFKYMFNDHVGIFADMGFGYYKRDREYKYWNNTGTLTDNETTTDESFALSRAILGVAFYL